MNLPRAFGATILVSIVGASQLTNLKDQVAGATVLIQTRASWHQEVGASRDDTQQSPLKYFTCREACSSDGCECRSCSDGLAYSCDECCCVCPSKPACPSTIGNTNNYQCESQVIKRADPISVPWASGKRVALLLRGGIFHHVAHIRSTSVAEDCSEMSNVTVSQVLATRSLVTNIVEPLESSGSTIDIFVTASTCHRIGEVVRILGRTRVRHVTTFDTHSQRDSVRSALDAFKHFMGGAMGAVNEYDLFVFARHDLVFLDYSRQALSHADPTKFNFLAPCYENMNTMKHYDQCTMDTFYMMPMRSFRAFDLVVGAPSSCCFQTKESDRFGGLCMNSGHFCLPALQEWIPDIDDGVSSFSFLFNEPRDQPGLYAQGRQDVALSISSL